MPRYTKFLAIFLLLIGFGLPAAWASGSDTGSAQALSSNPVAFIIGVGNQTVSLMGRQGGIDGATWNKLHKLVSDAADVRLLSQKALGRHWRRASSDQRQVFQALFVDYLLNRLSWFLGTAGVSKFDVIAWERKGYGETAVVSRLGTRSAGDIDVVWLVRDTQQGYRIADLTMSGVSVAALSRGEISAVAARQGVSGLIRLLQRRFAARAALR